MATTSIDTYTRVSITCSAISLTYTSDKYNFQFQCWRCVGATTTRYSPAEYYAPIVAGTSNTNYYETHIHEGLLPNNKYEIKIIAEYPKASGTWYNLGTIYQTTTNISKPASELIPAYYPNILDQNVWTYTGGNYVYVGQAGTCAANAMATMLDILKYVERASHPNQFSVGWIYGNRKVGDHSGEGLVIAEALENLSDDGSPYAVRIARPGYPGILYSDNYYADDTEHTLTYPVIGADDMIDANFDKLIHESRNQKINYTSTPIDFYDCAAIAAAITANKCCLVALLVGDEFYDCEGLLAEQSNTTYYGLHCAVLIGWGEVSSKDVWIAQNSWSDSWGDEGIFYIPMDYGLAVAAPNSAITLRWFYEAHAVQNIATPTPSTCSVELLTRYQDGSASLALYWDKEDYCDYYKLRYKISGGSYSYVDDIGLYGEADYSTDLTMSEYDLESLAYGTTYLISIAGRNSYAEEDLTSAYTTDAEATTAPKRPTQSKVSNTTTSINMSVAVSSGNWTFCRVYYKKSTDGSYTDYITITYPATTGTIPSLTAGLTYNVKTASYYTKDATDIQCRDSVGSLAYSSVINVIMKVRPVNWAWTTTVVADGTVVIDNANKRIKPLTAVEWNAFGVRINDFRDYKSLADYTPTSAVTNNPMTAVMANQARTAISAMSPPTAVPSVAVQGTKITSAFINGLKNSLNSIA